MGRDAFFNTEFERRFAFGIQSSDDIQLFGGNDITTQEDIAYGHYRHQWHAEKDMTNIHKQLEEFLEGSDIALPNFEKYERSLKGTQTLRYDLYKNRQEVYEYISNSYYTYELGCLIYHQLMYEPNLSVQYEP